MVCPEYNYNLDEIHEFLECRNIFHFYDGKCITVPPCVDAPKMDRINVYADKEVITTSIEALDKIEEVKKSILLAFRTGANAISLKIEVDFIK